MASSGIEFDPVFAEDYLYFYRPVLDQQAPDDVEAIWRLLGLAPEMDVLDLPCGYGRISNLLAQRGCHVTAVDSCETFWLQPAPAPRSLVRRLSMGGPTCVLCHGSEGSTP